MAAKKTTLKELGEMLAHVVKHMVTKDDLAEAVEKLRARIVRHRQRKFNELVTNPP
jgi:hypothetical protein